MIRSQWPESLRATWLRWDWRKRHDASLGASWAGGAPRRPILGRLRREPVNRERGIIDNNTESDGGVQHNGDAQSHRHADTEADRDGGRGEVPGSLPGREP